MTDIGQAVSELSSPTNWKAGGTVLVGFFVSDAVMPNLTKQVPMGEGSNLHSEFPEVNGILTAVGSYALGQSDMVAEETAEFMAYGGLASTLDYATERTGLKSQITNTVADAIDGEE